MKPLPKMTNNDVKDLLLKVGVQDEFLIEITKEIDWLEEELYNGSLNACRYIELNAKYNQLLEVRDLYTKLKKNI